MTSIAVRWVAAALIALPLAGGFAVQPVLAEEEPEEIVCWDGVLDGEETIFCEPKSVVAWECERNPSDNCPIVEDEAEIRPARTWEVPASLSEGSDSDSGHGGGGGGGGVGGVKPKQPNHF